MVSSHTVMVCLDEELWPCSVGAMGKDPFEEPRFRVPICTPRDVAALVDMPLDTVKSWAGQRSSRPQLIETVPQGRRGWPSIPLVGLAEASVLRALAAESLPRREVIAAARWLRAEYQLPHPLANRRLVTDGLHAYVESHPGKEDLYRVTSGQHVIVQVIREHLRPLRFEGEDEYPIAFTVSGLPGVEIDPRFNGGRMSFSRNRVPVFAVAGMLSGGEPVGVIADEYGLTMDEVRAVEQSMGGVAEAA